MLGLYRLVHGWNPVGGSNTLRIFQFHSSAWSIYTSSIIFNDQLGCHFSSGTAYLVAMVTEKNKITPFWSFVQMIIFGLLMFVDDNFVASGIFRLWQDAQNRVYLIKELDRRTGQVGT